MHFSLLKQPQPHNNGEASNRYRHLIINKSYLTPFISIVMATRNALQDANLALNLNMYLPASAFKKLKAELGGKVQPDGKVLSGDELYQHIIQKATQQLRNLGCFAAGTLVHTQEGLRPIEQIKVGDYVLSKPDSEVGGKLSYKRVTNTFEYEDKEVWYVEAWMPDSLRIKTDEDRPSHLAFMVVTGNHPVWVVNAQDWLPVEKLQPGMILKAHDDRYGVVQEVKKLIRMATPNYGWYSMGREEGTYYANYGWVVNVGDGQRCKRRYGILPGEPPLVPCDPEGNRFKHAIYLNEGVDWKNGGDEIYLRTKVYNLEVEDYHTYFVDHMGIWVHNQAGCDELLEELARRLG